MANVLNMDIILEDKHYLDDVDVLVRVYENQNPSRDEKSQVSVEVLFRNGLGIENHRATAWLPRGAAVFAVMKLKEFGKPGMKVQVANELPDNIGVLTSCRENWQNALESELSSLSEPETA